MEAITNESIKQVNQKYEIANVPNLNVNLEKVEFHSEFGRILYNDYELNLNNKLGGLRLNYSFLRLYFDRGIPDGKVFHQDYNKGGIRYFPDFKAEHYARKFWFGYYLDIFYFKLFSVYDSIYHLLNVYYDMECVPSLGFNKEVLLRLENTNLELFRLLEEMLKSESYKRARDLRNDLIHNFPPNYIGPRITIEKEKIGDKEYISESLGIGVNNYVTTSNFMKNIEDNMDLLKNAILKIKTEFEKERKCPKNAVIEQGKTPDKEIYERRRSFFKQLNNKKSKSETIE